MKLCEIFLLTLSDLLLIMTKSTREEDNNLFVFEISQDFVDCRCDVVKQLLLGHTSFSILARELKQSC
jgi:hypothetical protein